MLAALLVSLALPSPLARASAAIDGLVAYFIQTERNGTPASPATGCPCFKCDGQDCSKGQCAFCDIKGKCSDYGCFTTSPKACNCNDPAQPWPPYANSAASFPFACGQVGGSAAPGVSVTPAQCLCTSDWPSACENCYRWWSAVALEAMVNFAIASALSPHHTMSKRILDLAEITHVHAPYNGDWNATLRKTWIDDFAWYGLAYLRVYEWTGNATWRERAAHIHSWAWAYGWDRRLVEGEVDGPSRRSAVGDGESESGVCGGFVWSLLPQYDGYKDSITMVELLYLASSLASTAASNAAAEPLRRRAELVWQWLFAFDDGRGLLAPNGVMSTGAQPQRCCSASGRAAEADAPQCTNSGVPGMSYNHGLLLSSAARLYALTNNVSYLARAETLVASAVANLTNNEGAIRDVQRGSRAQGVPCNASDGHDAGTDFFSFKGIFATHVAYFARIVSAQGALRDSTRVALLSMLERSSDHAWTRSAAWPPFPQHDVCDVGRGLEDGKSASEHVNRGLDSHSLESHSRKNGRFPSPQLEPPKFRWWWSSDDVPLETPPDPRLWLSSNGLDCPHASALWNGTAPSQLACQARCADVSACSKYVWIPLQRQCILLLPVLGPERWRSPGCEHTADTSRVVGARRPPSPGTTSTSSCRARCVDQGEVLLARRSAQHTDVPSCQCDTACARHLDCCLDFAEQCIPSDRRTPSCEGRCTSDRLPPHFNNIVRDARLTVAGDLNASQTVAAAIPLPGGGYCFCNKECDNSFTDNNSHGGCCADALWRCSGGERDVLCMDARTQAQALGLFVAHHELSALHVIRQDTANRI